MNLNMSQLQQTSIAPKEILQMTAGFQASGKLIEPFPVNHQLACPALTTLPALHLRISIAQQLVAKDVWIPFPCSTMLVLRPQRQAYLMDATRTAQRSTTSLPTSGKTFTLSRKTCLAQSYRGSTLRDSQSRQWLSPLLTTLFLHSTAQSANCTKHHLPCSLPITVCSGAWIAMW